MAVIMHNYPVQIEQSATESTLLPVYGSKEDYQPEIVKNPNYNINDCKSVFDLIMNSGLSLSHGYDEEYFTHYGESNLGHDAQISDDLNYSRGKSFSINIDGNLLTLKNNSPTGEELTFVINNPSKTCLNIIKTSIEKYPNDTAENLKNLVIGDEQKSLINKELAKYSKDVYNRQIRDTAWYLTQREVMFINDKDGDKPYYSKWDIFESGNELVKEGKIKGKEMKKPSNMKDFIPEAVDGCEAECGNFKGVLWGFPEKPEPKDKNGMSESQKKNLGLEKEQKKEEVHAIKQSSAELANKANDKPKEVKQEKKENPLLIKLRYFGLFGFILVFVIACSVIFIKAKSRKKKGKRMRRNDLL